jgi:hypothetical protein
MPLAEAEIARAESVERRAISSDNVRVQRIGSRHEPRVVFAQATFCAALHQSAPSCVSEVQPLDRKSLQRGGGRSFVYGPFQKFLNANNRNNKGPAA